MDTRRAVTLTLLLAAAVSWAGCDVSPDGYKLDIRQTDAGLEHRFEFRQNGQFQHFGTLILVGGAAAFRPHPGEDPNGWGTTVYLQPFMAGAVLTHSAVDSALGGENGINIALSGKVSSGASGTFGDWTARVFFTFDPATKKVVGTGDMSIQLNGTIDATTGDLNVCRIASNYLDDVPLLSGGTGDTGDMDYANVSGNSFAFEWHPAEMPSHFPADRTDLLSIDVKGQYNEVDTDAQGFDAISAAYKPSMKVVLHSNASVLTFGGLYDTSVAQAFHEDNVGITPLIRAGTSGTSFNLQVALESVALPGDGT